MNGLPSRKVHPAFRPLALAAVFLLGLPACDGSQNEEAERATEEALATTASASDTADAPDTADIADTADTAGTWRQADTTGGRTSGGDTSGTRAAGSTPSENAAPSGAVTYQTYRNDKHSFSVRYPANLMQPAGEVGNGNGRTFRAPDGSASMLVYATGEGTSERVRRRFEEQTANPDLDITYRTHGENYGWYVLSGYRGDNIFYERVEARDNTLKVVRMFYDRSQEARFDPIVRTVSNSLEG
jgi:hypothetical protein